MEVIKISKKNLIELYQSKPLKEVLAELNISNGTLYKILRKNGIPTNRETHPVHKIEVVD